MTVNHRRTQRQSFSYSKDWLSHLKSERRQARQDLEYFIFKDTNHLSEYESSHHLTRTESQRVENILAHTREECREVFDNFLNCSFQTNIIQELAQVLLVCTTDKPLSYLVNHRSVLLAKNMCQGIANGDTLIINVLCVDMIKIITLFMSCRSDENTLTICHKINFLHYKSCKRYPQGWPRHTCC